jgi:ketosteroid isomerase-like protein
MKLFGSSDCVQLRAPAVVLFAALLLSAALLLLQVDAQERSADESGITAKVLSLEQLWNQAEVAKDTQSLDHLLADTFLFIDVDGSLLNKAEFLKSVTNRSEHIDSIRSESMLSRVHGDTVIVTGVYQEKGTLNGKAYYHHGRFTDIWVKNGSAWLCASSQSTLIQK